MQEEKLPEVPANTSPRAAAAPAASDDAGHWPHHPPGLLADLHVEDRDQRDDIDLLRYWHILLKRRWMIAAMTVSVLLVTLVLTLLAKPIYRATAVIQIDNEEQHVVQVGGVSAQTTYDPQFQETQYQLLRSRMLAERVADELGLDATEAERLVVSTWLDGFRKPLGGETKAETSARSESSGTASRSGIELIQKGLTIEPVRNSRLVRIHFDSPVPGFSARVANVISENFIASGLERRYGASSYAKTYLENQLKIVKARLEASERQLVAFAQRENLVSTAEGQSLSSQNLSNLNSALAAAQEQRIRAQARWSQARAARGTGLPADMLGNSIIRTLQEQRAQLQGQYQQKLQVFKPDYPEMRQLKSQMNELDKQLSVELANIRSSVRAEYTAAATQERLLQSQLGALRADTLDVDSRSIPYNILKREVDTSRQLYDSLLQRYKEVGVAGDLRSNNISIIDRAQTPTDRYKPSVSMNLTIGLMLGLVLAGLTAFLLEFLDDTLKKPDDLEQRLKLPVLGIIPKLSKQSPLEALRDPRSAFSESYRSVRTALLFSTNEGVPRTLLITSAVSGEGKTTTALTLARNFAELGKTVLLIEADLRNPSLHKLTGMSTKAGLSNVLSGAMSLFDATQATQYQGLKAMLAGPLPPNPAELLSGSKLMALLAAAAQQFDQVIIDGPPIMGIADAPILANAAAGTLVVVHAGKTRIAAAQAALKRLHAARARIVGGLLTQYDTKAAAYGYHYQDYYAYGVAPHLDK